MEDITEDQPKLDIKNIALKAPKKSRRISDQGFWKRIFWIDVPKRDNIANIRKEYLQVMENIEEDSKIEIPT